MIASKLLLVAEVSESTTTTAAAAAAAAVVVVVVVVVVNSKAYSRFNRLHINVQLKAIFCSVHDMHFIATELLHSSSLIQ